MLLLNHDEALEMRFAFSAHELSRIHSGFPACGINAYIEHDIIGQIKASRD